MKILAIDGGGVFGAIPAYLCSKIDVTQFDAYAGTSVGSILILSYACGKSSEDIFEGFNKAVYEIFSTRNPLGYLKGPRFNDTKLNNTLMEFIDRPIFSLHRPIFVPVYNISQNTPKIFDNILMNKKDEITTWEIARASCATPTYFSAWKEYIDGGIVANNPSMIAAWGLVDKLDIKFEEMEIFSIGTGWNPPSNWTTETINRWWVTEWVKPIINIAVGGNKKIFDFGCKHMPFKKYVRFDEIMPNKHENFTDPTCVPELIDKCKKVEDDFMRIYENFMRK